MVTLHVPSIIHMNDRSLEEDAGGFLTIPVIKPAIKFAKRARNDLFVLINSLGLEGYGFF